MIDTIFFDFNGTIIDDVDLCLNILNEMLVENQKPKVTKERYLEIFRFPIKSYYELAGFDFKERSFEELSHDFIEKYQNASLNCSLYSNVKKVLSTLKDKKYRLVLLSASQIDNLQEQVNHFGLNHFFEKILGIDDIFARSKVDIGMKYLKETKLNPKSCLMLGDTLHDKEVADKLGINIVLFSGGHQAKKVLAKANVKIVSSYSEFERYVEENENNN